MGGKTEKERGGENDSMRVKSRLKLISVLQGVK